MTRLLDRLCAWWLRRHGYRIEPLTATEAVINQESINAIRDAHKKIGKYWRERGYTLPEGAYVLPRQRIQ